MVSKTKEGPQTEMNVSDAMNVLAGFKNIWRATEKLDEALLVVSRAEGRAAELDAQNKDAEEKLAQKQASFDSTVAKLDAKEKDLADYEADLDQKKSALQKQFDADMAALNAHYSETSVAARDKVAADLKAEQERVDELTARKSDLQRDVRMTEAEVDTLTKKKAELEAEIETLTKKKADV